MKLNDELIEAAVKAYNKKESYPQTKEDFVRNCLRYIKAVKEHRVICSIGSVAPSGMSRTIKFLEFSKGKKSQHYLLNFWTLFATLGYTQVKNSDYFRVHGCGMDMVFATNYEIMHGMKTMGFISDKQFHVLAQKTPHVV